MISTLSTTTDLPTERIEEDGPTASERLRKRMFVYWKAKVNQGDFDTWRKQQVEMIGQYLDKLHWNETPPQTGGVFRMSQSAAMSSGGTSPSSQSCSSARDIQAVSIRLYRILAGPCFASFASIAQFAAFSRNLSDSFI
jgi:hypothetical protein